VERIDGGPPLGRPLRLAFALVGGGRLLLSARALGRGERRGPAERQLVEELELLGVAGVAVVVVCGARDLVILVLVVLLLPVVLRRRRRRRLRRARRGGLVGKARLQTHFFDLDRVRLLKRRHLRLEVLRIAPCIDHARTHGRTRRHAHVRMRNTRGSGQRAHAGSALAGAWQPQSARVGFAPCTPSGASEAHGLMPRSP
jgi:hypothetical protein